jgi:1-acyl-sn-glycerol-3-phosphate acyltransferase
MSACDAVLKGLFGGYRALFSRGLEISGQFPLPAGPKILAANHTTASDPIYLPYLLEEKTHCLFQNGLFAVPVLGWLFRMTGQVCVDREHGRAAYEQSCALLRAGKTLALFPEGRLCPREARLPAKSGTVRLALETGVPIIPMGFYVRPEDTLTLHLPGKTSRPGNWQVGGKCYLRFGEAWHPNPARSPAAQTEELMDRIYALVDQLAREVSACASPVSLNPIHQW